MYKVKESESRNEGDVNEELEKTVMRKRCSEGKE